MSKEYKKFIDQLKALKSDVIYIYNGMARNNINDPYIVFTKLDLLLSDRIITKDNIYILESLITNEKEFINYYSNLPIFYNYEYFYINNIYQGYTYHIVKKNYHEDPKIYKILYENKTTDGSELIQIDDSTIITLYKGIINFNKSDKLDMIIFKKPDGIDIMNFKVYKKNIELTYVYKIDNKWSLKTI